MSAGWVAGSVRARALARRQIGPGAARQIAACGTLEQALSLLAATPYRIGPGRAGQPARGTGLEPPGAGARPAGADGERDILAAVQHAIAESLLWNLRVLAGWLPRGGAQLMRTLAGWFEISNVTERMAELAGRPPGPEFRLGALGTAWPRLRQCASLAEVSHVLAASVWKDPGGQSPQAVAVGLRARWAQQAAQLGDPVRMLAAGAVALLLAGERFGSGDAGWLAGRPEHPVLREVAIGLLGRPVAGARSYGDLTGRLPSRLSWLFEPAAAPAELWRAEAGWWARMEREGQALLAGPGTDRRPVIGAVAVLAADARRVGAALESAARGGQVEVFDAVA